MEDMSFPRGPSPAQADTLFRTNMAAQDDSIFRILDPEVFLQHKQMHLCKVVWKLERTSPYIHRILGFPKIL